MAKLVVIDGPEKAGKTTFITALVESLKSLGLRATVRHWSTPDPKTFHSFVYRDYAAEAIAHNSYDVIIWDRSWVSEYVYPGLMPQFRGPRRVMWCDPWIGEWCFGRALQTHGMGLILLGPGVRELEQLRDDTDHDCPVFAERERYEYYGHKFSWLVLENFHASKYTRVLLKTVLRKLDLLESVPRWLRPPTYCGPVDAGVVFMGEAHTTHKTPRTWLPFSSHYTTLLGREFGDRAFGFGWTNARSLKYSIGMIHTDDYDNRTIQEFFSRKLVVACGRYAQDYCKTNGLDHYHIDHPAYGFRWGQRVEVYRSAIQRLKDELAARGVYDYVGKDNKKEEHRTPGQGSSPQVLTE